MLFAQSLGQPGQHGGWDGFATYFCFKLAAAWILDCQSDPKSPSAPSPHSPVDKPDSFMAEPSAEK